MVFDGKNDDLAERENDDNDDGVTSTELVDDRISHPQSNLIQTETVSKIS